VVTHRASQDLLGNNGGTFAFDGLQGAVRRATQVAGHEDVVVLGADVARQLLRADLLDEIRIHLVPLLLGEGTPLFDWERAELIPEGKPVVGTVTHLCFRVAKALDGVPGAGSEPFVDCDDVECGQVTHGEFVVPRGRTTVAFDPVDAALHRVALPVDRSVEGRWSATLRSLLTPVGCLVDLVGMVARWRRYSRLARELYALSASTRSGRVRGRPP
jgi:hypothetical protein